MENAALHAHTRETVHDSVLTRCVAAPAKGCSNGRTCVYTPVRRWCDVMCAMDGGDLTRAAVLSFRRFAYARYCPNPSANAHGDPHVN